MLIIDYMVKNNKNEKSKKIKTQPDWIAIILLIFGIIAIYNGNNVGFIFFIFALIKYFWTL